MTDEFWVAGAQHTALERENAAMRAALARIKHITERALHFHRITGIQRTMRTTIAKIDKVDPIYTRITLEEIDASGAVTTRVTLIPHYEPLELLGVDLDYKTRDAVTVTHSVTTSRMDVVPRAEPITDVIARLPRTPAPPHLAPVPGAEEEG